MRTPRSVPTALRSRRQPDQPKHLQNTNQYTNENTKITANGDSIEEAYVNPTNPSTNQNTNQYTNQNTNISADGDSIEEADVN